MASTHYFEFLGSVWDGMSEQDRQRFGELWQGMEQIVAAAYQKFAENNLNITAPNLEPYATERWLPYTFNDDNFIEQPAVLTSTQDLSLGINLSTRYLLRLSVDGGAPIEVNVQGANPSRTYVPEIIAKINVAFGFAFARGIFEDTVTQLVSPTSGILSTIEVLPTSIPGANACEFVLGIEALALPFHVPEYPWIYASPYPALAELPELQDHIRDESVETTLVEGPDYGVIDRSNIAFKEQPPENLWARRSLFDQETPWNNFGFLMDIYQKNSLRYVSVLQGLWFAFWTGPKPSNVKISLYLLFGLPTSQEKGTVTAVTTTLITVTNEAGLPRQYEIPSGLDAAVAVGDSVEQFTPLVTGIEVFDKINRPGFFAEEIGRAGLDRFLTEDASRGPGDTDETKALTMLEEHTFLPQISVESFVNPDINLANVQIFLNAIKPLSKTYLFQVIVGAFADPIVFLEHVSPLLELDVTPNLDANETSYLEAQDLLDYETLDNDPLNLDSEVVLFQEDVEIEVYSFGSLIDSFTA